VGRHAGIMFVMHIDVGGKLLMKLRWEIVGAIGMLLMLATGCARQTVAQPAGDEELRPDVQAYAEAQGISVEEADRRLGAEEGLGQLQERLAAEEAGTFGGLWIEHEPSYRVVVAFTRDGAQTLQRYVKDTPLEGVAEAREVAVTQAELESAQAATIGLLEELGSGANTGIDIRQNCVSLYVADLEVFEAQLAASGQRLPDAVCIEVVGPYAEAPPLEPIPGLHFPRQDPPEGVFAEMMALMMGELVEENGCLRVRGGEDPALLVIWPYDHTLTVDAGGIAEVRDGTGAVVARVGDTVEMGGGQAPSLTGAFAAGLPKACTGPYWIAARGIRSTR
jgi:hypothetical protein